MTSDGATFQEEAYWVTINRDPTTGVAAHEFWSSKRQGAVLPDFDRTGGPARIIRDPSTGVVLDEQWYRAGKLHRDDGPAIVRRTPDGKIKYTSWYQDGELIPYRRRPKNTPVANLSSRDL
jgi:hypothetical protein